MLMQLSHSHPPRSRRRLLGISLALPLLAAGFIAPPAQADPTPTAPADNGITVSGNYNPGGAGCQGTDNSIDCLTWGVRVPSSIAPHKDLSVTIEADSVPGQWTWNCSDEFRVAGTAAFFNRSANGELNKMGESGLGLADPIVYTRLGSSAGSPTNVNCTPEHLSLTYTIDYLVREEGSYLDLNIGTAVTAPGTDARDYTFTPTITTSEDATPQTPVATAQKPAASAPHATVTTETVTVDGAAKDAARFTMKAKNDSTTPMSDFTVSAGRSRGQAQVAALTCDLTAFGGEVVSTKGPAESLTVPSGKATIPSGKEITCQVDLTGVAGRNTVTAGITTGDQTFSSDHNTDRPVGEVTVQATDQSVGLQGPDAMHDKQYVSVSYTVTFTNKTDAEGSFPNLVLRPQSPAGLTFERINGDGPWWFNRDSDALTPSADGTVQVPLNSPLSSNSSETFTFTADYAIDTAAMTDNDWKALGACDPKDPSKGVTTQIDVDGNGAGFEAGSFTTCTPVTRPQG